MSKLIRIAVLILYFQANLLASLTYICQTFYDPGQNPFQGEVSVSSFTEPPEKIFHLLERFVVLARPDLQGRAASIKDLLVLILNNNISLPEERCSDDFLATFAENFTKLKNVLFKQYFEQESFDKAYLSLENLLEQKISECILSKSVRLTEHVEAFIQELNKVPNGNNKETPVSVFDKFVLQSATQTLLDKINLVRNVSELFTDPSKFISHNIIYA